MDSIRVKRREIIEIEVNDEHEAISIDPNDRRFVTGMTGFVKTLKDCMSELQEHANILKLKAETDPDNAIIKAIEYEAEISNKAAKELEGIFGEGTCDKVFGKGVAPSLDMINDFFTQIVPFIQKALDKRNRNIGSKYAPKRGGSV